MIIRTLVENTSSNNALKSEHGLSLYIETKKHKLLFDMGATGLFAENAAKMNVDLSEVDTAVLSHGHYDHGGGLEAFLKINSRAVIYLNQDAFGMYYSKTPDGGEKYIGLDQKLIGGSRFVFVGRNLELDEELFLFSGVNGKRNKPSGNKDLFKEVDGAFLQDDFAHEQNLLIKEEGKTVLLAGCAHNGIINILEHLRYEKGLLPDCTVGGFHLYNRASGENENPASVEEIGNYLVQTGSTYYTCHCTGMESYRHLKAIMKNQLYYLSTGDQLII